MSMLLTIILVVLGFIELALIVLLLIKLRSSGNENVVSDEEYNELEYSYKKLKSAIKESKTENEFLQKQVSTLEKSIEKLEAANFDLHKQKEKLKKSKLKLEELQKQKEELYAVTIHDLKNPAAAIKSYVELLNSYELNAQEQQEIMTYLLDSSEQIIKLAGEVTRVITQKKDIIEFKKEVLSIKDIVDKVCNKHLGYANKKKVKLINKSSENLPEVEVDKMKMEEALDNLVNNAIKFGYSGTIVEVKTFFSEKHVNIEVEDDGVGMKEDDLKKVFNKGASLSAKPTGGETSSGLGLWIVKNIVEAHDGKIWVKSKENLGTTFGIELPY